MNTLTRLYRHLWLDASDAQRTLGDDGVSRLEAAITRSETRHTGEVCLCIEASLPPRYLWRSLWGRVPIADVVHDRALSLFSKLGVWDTELNNGVLIYVQLAEHRIEIVADRGLAQHVSPQHWETLVAQAAESFRAGAAEQALLDSLNGVSAALETWFPRTGEESRALRGNQLPNHPVLR